MENFKIVGLDEDGIINDHLDQTPLNFFLWEKLKTDVYYDALTTKEDMKECIKRACAAIDQDISTCNV